MRRFNVDAGKIPSEICDGISEVCKKYPGRFSSGENAVDLVFMKTTRQGGAVCKSDKFVIEYSEKSDAFRALGRLLGEDESNSADFSEIPFCKTRGVMFDVSRNGVLRPDTVCDLLCRMALMGINMVMLYTEDIYEIEGKHFFGYLRGRYSNDELKKMDSYAWLFGIEMFPCIQTLGHMYEVLQWPVYADLVDTHQILLADYEKTYEFIEKMIVSASSAFKCKRIHIGMDEALLGRKRYRDIYGEKDSFELFNRHLNRVNDICKKHGLKPMMWSDMYFKLGSKRKADYDEKAEIPEEVIRNIPKDVQQVYWEYYAHDKTSYDRMIQRHKAFGAEPVMAGGVLTWNRFWATLPFSFKAIDACMASCRENGIKEVFMTLWGDGGAECDFYSALPGLQYFAEYYYSEDVDDNLLRENFRGSCDTDFDDFVKASGLDTVPSLEDSEKNKGNISKWLLWQDPFMALMDPLVGDADLSEHYRALADNLEKAVKKGGLGGRLVLPAKIADVLELKAHFRKNIYDAYKSQDRDELKNIQLKTIPELIKRYKVLWQVHRENWMNDKKPFGWEIVERNYGLLILRLDTVAMQIGKYLSGENSAIEELDEELLPFYKIEDGSYPIVPASRVISPTVIK